MLDTIFILFSFIIHNLVLHPILYPHTSTYIVQQTAITNLHSHNNIPARNKYRGEAAGDVLSVLFMYTRRANSSFTLGRCLQHTPITFLHCIVYSKHQSHDAILVPARNKYAKPCLSSGSICTPTTIFHSTFRVNASAFTYLHTEY